MTDVCIRSAARPVTLKRSRPNPVFQEWLEELLEEAKRKKCKLEHQLTEALSSLSKYPLPLNTGAECKILKGFDSRLCDFIDQRIAKLSSQETYADTIKGISNDVAESHLLLKNTEDPKYIRQLLNYCSVLTSLKQFWIDGNVTVPVHMLLSQTSKEIFNITNKVMKLKSLTKFPQNFKPLRELIEVDLSTGNLYLTNTGFSEACHVDNLLDGFTSNIHSSTQTDSTIVPSTYIDTYDLTNEDKNFFEMEPGSFDIILLIDKNETSGLANKNDPTVTQFKKYSDLKHEYRSLKVGDFAWVARHKINSELELVLPYIVERKRLDDLSASIKDGRFHEQKFRLRRCGLSNIIYMVENYATKKYTGLPVQTLMQALANTRVQDGFKVHITDSLVNSVRFLAMMTTRLIFEYKGKTIKGHDAEADCSTYMTFQFFNKMSVKSKALTITEMFIKLLLQLKGLSVEKALAITNIYKTPKSLMGAYKYLDKDEGETLLANLKYGPLNRNVGPAVSKSLYQLFSSFDIS